MDAAQQAWMRVRDERLTAGRSTLAELEERYEGFIAGWQAREEAQRKGDQLLEKVRVC